MKKIAVFCAALALVGLMAGCGKGKASAAGKPVTLQVLWFNDANESDVFLDTIKDYLDAHPEIKLDMQVIAFGDYDQKLSLMVSGGNPPDIARVTTASIPRFIDTFLPLDDAVEGFAAMKANFMPSMLAFATNKEGKITAFPTEATANGMLVNKTAFKNAGIDVDTVSKTWTWDEWTEVAKKVVAANEGMKYGLGLDYTPHRFSTLMYQFGGHFLNADQTGMDFANPGTIRSIEFIKDLHTQGLMPPSVWMGSENPAELFQAGMVACHIGGSWNINTYNKNVKNFEWGAVQMPKGEIRSSVPGGKFVASFKSSAHAKEAAELMRVFADKEHTASYAKGTFNMSARVDTTVEYSSNTADFAVFADELKVTPAFTANEWKTPALTNTTAFVRDQIVSVLLDKATAADAAKAVDVKGNAAF